MYVKSKRQGSNKMTPFKNGASFKLVNHIKRQAKILFNQFILSLKKPSKGEMSNTRIRSNKIIKVIEIDHKGLEYC